MTQSKPVTRYDWVSDNELMVKYHDEEWGIPIHDDKILFEFLTLEGAQAGLNWQTVLNKRERYRAAFSNFDANKISLYDSKEINRLLANPGIIRNKLKVASAIQNAKKFLEIQKEFGSFDNYLWKFVDHKPIRNKRASIQDIPTTTRESDAMSKDMKKRGLKFVGSTICYAFMQAVGMVDDHTVYCFKYKMTKKIS